MSEDTTASLVALGFNGLEAEAYAFLLGETSATGYRVAQAIGKPVANTYKALESLERKGAVLVDDGKNRIFRAVSAGELLGRLQRVYAQRCKEAAETLAQIDERPGDDRLYQLSSRAQVLERCRSMLRRCRRVCLVDIAPSILAELRDEFPEAAERDVEVVIKTYEPAVIRGARVVVRPRGHEIIDALPGSTISLNTDGAEHLLALLKSDGDGVYQAVWTGSAIVSYLLYNGLINEVSQVAVMRELEGETTVEALRNTFTSLRHLHPVSSRGPAYQNLMQRLGTSTPTRAEADGRRSLMEGKDR